ncbi:MAG: AAA family ATPase, partial [Chitinophagales bacterium]
MKLQVQNLGPIKFGEIDLSKRFYVFVGYNNSGKTYVGQLLWSLFALKQDEYSHKFIDKESNLKGDIEVSESDIKQVIEEFEVF